METIIKIGGSLAETPSVLKRLGTELSSLAKAHNFIVIPGGGIFADAVRQLDVKFKLSAALSHKLAILAMNQYGLALSEIFPRSVTSESIEEAKQHSRNGYVSIFLPAKMILAKDPFDPSWDVTSDSIAGQIAVFANIPLVIFVTNVDGVFTEDPNKKPGSPLLTELSVDELIVFKQRTSVDRFLPTLLSKNSLDCFVVNGKFPKRIDAILSGQKTVATHIRPKNSRVP